MSTALSTAFCNRSGDTFSFRSQEKRNTQVLVHILLGGKIFAALSNRDHARFLFLSLPGFFIRMFLLSDFNSDPSVELV